MIADAAPKVAGRAAVAWLFAVTIVLPSLTLARLGMENKPLTGRQRIPAAGPG